MNTKRKGQGALEYLIIVAGALGLAALVTFFVTQTGGTAAKQNMIKACVNGATTCINMRVTNKNYDCSLLCAKACSDPTSVDEYGNPSDLMRKDVYYNMEDFSLPPRTKEDPVIDLEPGTAAYYCEQGLVGMISYSTR